MHLLFRRQTEKFLYNGLVGEYDDRHDSATNQLRPERVTFNRMQREPENKLLHRMCLWIEIDNNAKKFVLPPPIPVWMGPMQDIMMHRTLL